MKPSRHRSARLARALARGLLPLASALACADAAPPAKVVLVTLDTTRADHLGLYGYFRDTSPRLDAFAASARVYERALAPMATTLPSHVSILTARAPLEHGVLANLAHGGRRFAPAPGLRSFAEICRDAGWRTGAFVSAAPLERGSGVEAGFEVFHEPGPGYPQRRGEFTTNAALRWLAGIEDEPYFLWLHYYDAHWPFDPPQGFAGRYASGPELDAWLAARGIPDGALRSGSGWESTREAVNAYDAELRYQDAQLGRLLDALAARPDWQRTAVAIVGDHGEGLAQHGIAAHGGTWDEQLWVPLLLRLPGRAPERIAAPLPVADALAIVADALATPALGPFLAQAAPQPEGRPVMSQDAGRLRSRPGYRLALTDARWKYLRIDLGGGASLEELYDLASDPHELRDVAAQHPALVRERALDLDARVSAQASLAEQLRQGAPELAPEPDPELARRLEALGYVEDAGVPDADGGSPTP